MPSARRSQRRSTPPRRLRAQASLEDLARQLDKAHAGTAGSFRSGLVETLTAMRLGVPRLSPARSRSTNAVASMNGICRDRSSNVKNWQAGQTASAVVLGTDGRSCQAIPPCQRAPSPRPAHDAQRRIARSTSEPVIPPTTMPMWSATTIGPSPKLHKPQDVLSPRGCLADYSER